jgi:hypothetical protein
MTQFNASASARKARRSGSLLRLSAVTVQKTTFSDAIRPQFENIARHPARPYDPRTGL